MKRELWYSVVVRDRDGKIVSRERHRSRSFLKQWNELVFFLVTGVPLSVTNTDGEAYTLSEYANNFSMGGDYGAFEGIVIGTGNTAVAIDDYSLETLIADGSGAGEMDYQLTAVGASVVSAPNCGFLVERAFVNNSGAEITVRESGLYVYCNGSAGSRRVCGVRDVFGTPQAVPNGGSLSVNYTLRVTA